jgi:hypothetical protein
MIQALVELCRFHFFPPRTARSEVAGVGLHMCARAQSSQIQMRASSCRRKGGATGAPGKAEIGTMDRPGKGTTDLRALQGSVIASGKDTDSALGFDGLYRADTAAIKLMDYGDSAHK